MIISGGVGAGTKVEVISPSGEMPSTLLHEIFYLPDLPEERTRHTINKNIVCGGVDTEQTCIRMNSDWGVSFK